LDVASGELLWQKDLPAEYGAKTPLWGYAAHPLIDGNKLITNAGGEGAHAVAFDLDTGEEIWRTGTSAEQGYSPPTIIEAGGTRQLILFRPNAVTSVDPETGQQHWAQPYEATNGLVSMSPVVVGKHLYVGGYSDQSLLLTLAEDAEKPTIEWGNRSKHGMAPVNVQPFVDGDIIYGVDQNGLLMAVQIPSGERLWETSDAINGGRPGGSDTVFIVRQADRYWLFNELGELLIAQLSPEGYQEIDRAKLLEPTNNAFGRDVVWCMPAFANRRIYVRNDDELICVDLSKAENE
jgi:outer membrane protein assembly factor BamB